MTTPLVSVIIPVFNGADYLAEAIQSVLDQTYRPLEIIVVDDGSTDASPRVAESFGTAIGYHAQPNCGTGAARNEGVRLSTGSYLAFLDQDDLWLPDKLAHQMTALAERQSDTSPLAPVLGGEGSGVRGLILGKEEPLTLTPRPGVPGRGACRIDAVFGMVRQFRAAGSEHQEPMAGYLPSALLIRRDSFARVGPFGTGWVIGEWADWYARAIDVGLAMALLPQLVAWRRLHASNKGLCRPDRGEYVRVLKASLDRRRATDALAPRSL